MIETFAKAPLVEIVAELRWQPSQLQTPLSPAGAGPPLLTGVFIGDTKLEEFFLGFASQVNKLGFPRAERLIPSGVPLIPFQPVWRFRKSDEKGTVLYQIGPGLFSANAVPPYRSWRDFSPSVKSGVEALLQTRAEAEKSSSFFSAVLRYINGFDSELTQGREVGSFMADVLKIEIKVPNAIRKHMLESSAIKPALVLAVPIVGATMTVNIAEAQVSGKPAILMDSNVASRLELAADVDLIMERFHRAREVLHEMFMELTEPIHPLMRPEVSQ
jgi:uncharacterized protein (TIGR04255 family)